MDVAGWLLQGRSFLLAFESPFLLWVLLQSKVTPIGAGRGWAP